MGGMGRGGMGGMGTFGGMGVAWGRFVCQLICGMCGMGTFCLPANLKTLKNNKRQE